MHKLKLQYLQEQNQQLRRQISELKKILSVESEANERSVMFQLRQQKQLLAERVSQLSDELLLEREARQIETSTLQETLKEAHACIFTLKEQLRTMTNILRDEGKLGQQSNIIERWIKQKFEKDRREIFHKYAHPLLFFEILEEIIETRNHQELTEDPEDTRTPIFDIPEKDEVQMEQISIAVMKHKQPWFEDKSQVYFLQKKRKENLHLKLQRAKFLQYHAMNLQPRKETSLTNNVPLLKQSYLNLILEYENLRKKLVFYEKYISELENRNQLLIDSSLQIGRVRES